MKIKKYTARTESEAIIDVKNELGLDALILSIKKIQPKGFFAFLRKPQVEVTAAYDVKAGEAALKPAAIEKPDESGGEKFSAKLIAENKRTIKSLEESLSSKNGQLGDLMAQLAEARRRPDAGVRYENEIVRSFYETLTGKGVAEDVADHLLAEAGGLGPGEADIGLVTRIVYNNILNVIGKPVPLVTKGSGGCLVNVFMGPTGVGKTTTIAKLTSELILRDNVNLGLITADTYRIAAVAQLKTYAEILSVEVGVVYTTGDFIECIGRLTQKYEMVLVDTAGRSHKNTDNLAELSGLLAACPGAEKHLVLSLTTKYEDLLEIIDAYSGISDFDIIFTKLDETLELGSIVNVCYITEKRISYVTNGQNVPDDIELIEPEKIARALLGLGGV